VALGLILWTEAPAQTTNLPGVTTNVPGLAQPGFVPAWGFVQASTAGQILWPTGPVTWASTNVVSALEFTNGAVLSPFVSGFEIGNNSSFLSQMGVDTMPLINYGNPPLGYMGDFANPSINSLFGTLTLYTGSNNMVAILDSLFNQPVIITNGVLYGSAGGLTNHVFNQDSTIPTNAVPGSVAGTTTNWLLVNLGGIPTLIATNQTTPYGWLKKSLWP
jgi:hypothetical protein